MELLIGFLSIVEELNIVFRQKRTHKRAVVLMLACLLCFGRHWITRWICIRNRQDQDWSADYKLLSRAKWNTAELFLPAMVRTIQYFTKGPIVLAGDETKLKRAGRRVKRSTWLRDPMSPPFNVNLIKGIRFVQFSALLPLHQLEGQSCRAIPVSLEPIDIPRKPTKRATEQEHLEYKKAKKQNNMCMQAVRQMKQLRIMYDQIGARQQSLVMALDGGFCNRTIFTAEFENTVILARARKDARLCLPADDPDKPRKVYSDDKFTPERIRQNESIEWKTTEIFFGGQTREIRYKEVRNVLWQRGSGRKLLRVIVVAPTGYRLSPKMKKYYREPAYLLTTDLELATEFLLQSYFDRWQIEVNHRDEKQNIGIADPQVWNDNSVDRQPAFMAAAYSFLLLASLEAYGAKRTNDYIEHPQWQRRRRRPSCQDILHLLRKQAIDSQPLLKNIGLDFNPDILLTKMAA